MSLAVAAWAATNRVQSYFTTTDASRHNRIDRRFGPLKKFPPNHSDQRNQADQEAAMLSHRRWRNR